MNNHDEDFDLEFAPEYAGQAEDEEVEDVEQPEEEYDEEEYEESDESEEDYEESDDEEDGEEYEQEETVPLSRYNELRKFATQRSMELADVKRELLSAIPPAQAPEPAKPTGNVLTRSFEEILEAKVNEKLDKYLAPIREQEAELEMQSNIIALAEADSDFSDVSPYFLKQLEEAPQLFNIENGIQIAYRAAKAEYLAKVTEARVRAETQSAVQRKAMKETISDGSSYTRPTQSKARSEADMIREAIMGVGARKTF